MTVLDLFSDVEVVEDSGAVSLFDYGGSQLRVVDQGGNPWFVAKDVCDVLGIVNTTQAVAKLDDDERAMLNIGPTTSANTVSEAGLYSLILGSRKPEAKLFKRWITHEVLPTIRKTGGAYIAPGSKAEFDLADPDTMLDALEKAVSTAKGARAELVEANRQISHLKPRAVASEITEDHLEGVLIRDMKDAIAANLGIEDRSTVLEVVRRLGVYQVDGNVYEVSPDWDDILLCSEVSRTVKLKYGRKKTYHYNWGPVRVRPGCQEEFLERLTATYKRKVYH